MTSTEQVLKRALLGIYYVGSQPWRALRNRSLNAAGRAPIMILFYHRVADDWPNPWTCSTRVFANQMRWLKARFDMVTLAEARRRILQPSNERPCVSITFDDGYADNCRFALPFLNRESIPCTYFVATHYVFEGVAFPHDVARREPHAPNTLEQLRELAGGGVEIGAHTRTHADLGAIHGATSLEDEIVGAGKDLSAAIGQRVRYFAFPYGQHQNLSSRAFGLARQAGYEAVCSAYGGFNFPGDDAFHLQRIHADDDMIHLKNWTTVDPRKLGIPRFEYLATQAPVPRGGSST